jgi:protein transport protein SEC61 subunit gamma-like protein
MALKDLVSINAWKEKLAQWKRTLEISQKPDKEEFVSSAKITALGILLIGAIGFVIFIAYFLLTNIGQ